MPRNGAKTLYPHKNHRRGLYRGSHKGTDSGQAHPCRKAPKKAERRSVNLLIDIVNSIKGQQSRSYEQWAKIHNLKQAAKTMNFLTENKIEQYTNLPNRIKETATASEQAGDSLKEVEKRLSDMALLIKNVTTYQKTKPFYEAYRKARNKEKYRAEHERDIILHEAAAGTKGGADRRQAPQRPRPASGV